MGDTILGILAGIFLFMIFIVGCRAIIARNNNTYNSVQYDTDVQVTEWISPDGVHYWYHSVGYYEMLAPRYDKNGELVIEK